MKVYLDNAATTAIDPQVVDAMMPYLTEHYGNPSSIHGPGRVTRAAIEKARKTVADCLNCSTSEIFFTSCGTESNNMALKCMVNDFGVRHIITSPIEHHCVLHTVENIGALGAVEIHMVNVCEQGFMDLKHLEELLAGFGDERALVTLMHANNEIGTMIDLEAVGTICERHGALFHSDTVQTMAHYPMDLQQLKMTTLTGSAHKFHGPKGIGFIYINADTTICPYIHGGGQERNMRAGTENLYGIVGLAAAMKIAYDEMEEHKAHIQGLKYYMKDKLEAAIPEIAFNGDLSENSLYTVLNVSFPSYFDAEMLAFNLDINGIACSGGSACSSGSQVGSHVIRAIGGDPSRKAIRFSFSKFNTKEEIDYVVEKVAVLAKARSFA